MGMLWGHTQEAQLLSYLKDGVSAFKSRTEEYRGTALESDWCDAFAGASFLNHVDYRKTTPSSYGRKLRLYFNGDVW